MTQKIIILLKRPLSTLAKINLRLIKQKIQKNDKLFLKNEPFWAQKFPKINIFTLNLGHSQQLQEYKHLEDSKARHVPLMKLIGHWVLPVDLILKDTEHQYNPWIVKKRNIAVQILLLFNFGGGVDKVEKEGQALRTALHIMNLNLQKFRWIAYLVSSKPKGSKSN